MEKQLPNNIQIAFANGDIITDDNGQRYYDYYNTSLRWICGYNNVFISEQIVSLSSDIKKDPSKFQQFFSEINSEFTKKAGKKFKYSNFLNKPVPEILQEIFKKDQNFPVFLSNNPEYISNNIFTNFLELFCLEKDQKNSKLTPEGWSITQIKRFFKHYKKQISLFILAPVLPEEGIIISQETASLLESCCNRYNIPLIWDESLTCFYRSGTFFMLEQYSIHPDFISIDCNVYQDKKVHIIIINKSVSRKIKKLFKHIPNKKEVINIILIKSILSFIQEFKIPEYINNISYRLEHKLMALSSNLKNRFELKSIGLITLLKLSNDNYAEKLNKYLKEKHILCYFNKKQTFILIPQIILSAHSVDVFVQDINNFFHKGIKIINK